MTQHTPDENPQALGLVGPLQHSEVQGSLDLDPTRSAGGS